MNKLEYLALILFFTLLTSCGKELRYDEEYSEAVPRLELKRNPLENLNQDSFFKPGQLNYFFSTYNIFLKTDLTNNTRQIIENLTIMPKMVVTYENGFVKSFDLGKFNRKNFSLKPNEKYVFENLFRLDTLKKFKLSYFIHDVTSVEVFLNTTASNSVGLNIKLKDENFLSIDITNSWNELREFNNQETLKSFGQVYGCYPYQLAILQTQYNERVDTDNKDIIQYFSNRENIYLALDFYELNWTQNRYEEALNKLLDKYFSDLKSINAVTPKFEILFDKYRKEYFNSLKYRREILKNVENSTDLQRVKIDSLERLRTEKVKIAVKTFSDAMKELGTKNNIPNSIGVMKNFDAKYNLK